MMRFLIYIFFVFSAQSAVSDIHPWSSTLPLKSNFSVSASMRSRVNFWVDIYSYYTTTQGVFHNLHNPAQIYGEIDLTDIRQSSILTEKTKLKMSLHRIESRRKKIVAQFKIKKIENVRLQMGLKDRMQEALFISGKYLPMMEQIFKEKKLPAELTRIVFVESSFNIFAQSKVGASGLWQIMPAVARAEGYLQKYYDKRNHPYYSTVLAADILEQNYKSLKSWPLAITAYNHGLTGVRRMQNKVGSNQVAMLIDSKQRTRSWGFASENFYACFLAVLEVEKKATDFFGTHLTKSRALKVKNIYLKTATRKNAVLKIFGGSIRKLNAYNPHLNYSRIKTKKYFPAGVPLIIPVNAKL